MLTGKKFPQNVRALRMVAEEILRQTIQTNEFSCMDDLFQVLDDIANRSKTTKVWVDCLIKPVFIMMKYVRAEREGDWPLHLEAFSQMMPYFFAAGHVNYARYGLYYLRCMESLPSDVLEYFMKGDHVMRHVPGIWNGIWSDMYIETTFMRYGHGKRGIIGITLKPETLKTWALSLHICSHLEANLADMVEGVKMNVQSSHKEEGKGRITSDGEDRKGLQKKLEKCTDALNPEMHPSGTVNIVSGKIGDSSINVHNAVEIGKSQMQEFEKSWPKGFHDTIKKKVKTMSETKKHVKVGDVKVFDTNLIYSRVIGLQASSRDVDIIDVLSHELAPVPTAMFDETGEMRISKSKSTLKKQLQVEVSARTVTHSKVTIIDGSALLWVVHWPIEGTVQDYVRNFRGHIERMLENGDVYLVFDRYYEYSSKSVTRSARNADASRVHMLQATTTLPSQKVALTVTENKRQIMDIICTELAQDKEFHQRCTKEHKLLITGQSRTPTEIGKGGVVILRRDLDTTHEEADIIIVQQMLLAAKENPTAITVISDDTDVFILLLHCYLEDGLQMTVTMESPISGRAVRDIGKTVSKHKDIIPDLLAVHALSGCDTVACCFGIGKGTALKVLRSGHTLQLLGHLDVPLQEIVKEATSFMATCYGQSKCESMSSARLNVWAVKAGKGFLSAPKVCALPPTTESFTENVKRAHFQVCAWRSVRDADPPSLEPEIWGWKRDENTKSLLPVTLPENVPLAPDAILKLIRCSCDSGSPCSSARCGCNSAKLPCTVFCTCHGTDCYNTFN